jgi:hypothetical protein
MMALGVAAHRAFAALDLPRHVARAEALARRSAVSVTGR